MAPIDRREVKAISARHRGDAYDKSFDSGDHLQALIFAQFAAATSLRGLAAEWNAYCQHHYHLGGGKLARSTLADANRRRPPAVFAEIFAGLAAQLDPRTRREGHEVVRVIDSTPIPLGTLCTWATSNGRIRGLKLHIVFDPAHDCPRVLDITDANVNDAQIGRTAGIAPGATYTFDKGYCHYGWHYGWWRAIDAAGAYFVTRPRPTCGSSRSRSAPARRPPATASPSPRTPRCASPARAIRACPSGCAGSGSGARTAAQSRC